MRNLKRLTNAASNIEAAHDCNAARFLARVCGVEPPPLPARRTHRSLDAYTGRLLKTLRTDWTGLAYFRAIGRVPRREGNE